MNGGNSIPVKLAHLNRRILSMLKLLRQYKAENKPGAVRLVTMEIDRLKAVEYRLEAMQAN